jgi:alcohol dehydrogenase, propanol-preferring
VKAAVVHDFHSLLVIEERPVPEIGAGEVLVRTVASGLCHTDIHAAHGDWPIKPKPPFVPGHEGVGIVERVGPGVARVAEGDLVAVPWLGWACGQCEACISGWETLCERQVNTGYGIDGGFAEYIRSHAAFVGRVPDGVSPIDAAPLTCAGVTTYKAVKVGGVRPSELVAVFGIGGLGHLALQYAGIAGGTVVAVDVVPEKLQLARDLGAAHTVDAAEDDAADAIRRLGGADVAVVLAANPKVFEQAFRSLRRGGRLVLVGLPADNVMHLPIFETVLQGITVTGSIVGTRNDLAEVFQLHADGRTRVVSETIALDDVNEAIARVERGDVPARLVFTM